MHRWNWNKWDVWSNRLDIRLYGMATLSSITNEMNIAACKTGKKHLEHEDPLLCPVYHIRLQSTRILAGLFWEGTRCCRRVATAATSDPPRIHSLLHQWLYILVLGLRFYRAMTVIHLFGTLSRERSPACGSALLPYGNLPDSDSVLDQRFPRKINFSLYKSMLGNLACWNSCEITAGESGKNCEEQRNKKKKWMRITEWGPQLR